MNKITDSDSFIHKNLSRPETIGFLYFLFLYTENGCEEGVQLSRSSNRYLVRILMRSQYCLEAEHSLSSREKKKKRNVTGRDELSVDPLSSNELFHTIQLGSIVAWFFSKTRYT